MSTSTKILLGTAGLSIGLIVILVANMLAMA